MFGRMSTGASAGKPPPPARRVAVVVLAGVGGEEAPAPDGKAAPSTARTLAESLARTVPEYQLGDPKPLSVTVPRTSPEPDEWETAGEVYVAPRETLTRGTDRIDVVELVWSDLSRFPSGLRGFVVSLFGLGLQLVTPGLEVLKACVPPGPGRLARRWLGAVIGAAALGAVVGLLAVWPFGADADAAVLAGVIAAGAVLLVATIIDRPSAAATAHSLGSAASWLIASIVVPLTAVVVVFTTAFWLVIDETLDITDAAVPLIVGVPGAFLIWKLGKGITEGGWGYGGGSWRRVLDCRLWTVGMFLVVLAMSIWFYVRDDGSLTIALADTLLYAGGFGLKAAWLGGVSLVGLALVSLLVLLVAWARSRRKDEGDDARWVTASLCTAISPLLVALFGTLIFAGIAGIAFSSAKDARWGAEAQQVRCLKNVQAWSTGTGCGTGTPEQWELESKRIVGLHKKAARESKEATKKRTADVTVHPALGPRDLVGAATLDARAKADLDAAAAIEADAGATPVDWARSIFLIIGNGSLLALLAALLLLLLAIGALAWLVLDARGAPPIADGRSTGLGLTHFLNSLRRPWPALLTVLIAIAVGVGIWGAWAAGWSLVSVNPWASGAGKGVVSVGAAAGILTVLARFFPLDPRKWGEKVGGSLETFRRVIDHPYDIVTYLRIANDGKGVRPRIIARHRALLRHLRDQDGGYDAIVIAAHSQGSMLSLATLLGDRNRQKSEGDRRGAWGVASWRGEPPAKRMAVLSFGCPARQTYGARFPGDYDRLWAPGTQLRPINVVWTNVYRARDYLGKAVFHDPFEERFITPRTVFRLTMAQGVVRRDVCLPGLGSHTGYFSDPELARWLDLTIRQAAGLAPPTCIVDGYSE
jgi:hypothetical protein